MKEINLVQGSPEWEEFRKDHIGASDSPIIMGKSPWKKPLQLWEEKMMGKTGRKTAAMERGNELEQMVRDWYSETRIPIRPGVFVDDRVEWMSVSFDGVSEDLKTIVEIKCPGEKSFKEFLDGKIPEHYMIQMQHQMFVAEVDQCVLLVSDGTVPPIEFVVDKNTPMILKIFDACKAFHTSMLEFTPPEPSGSDIVVREDRDWVESANDWLRAKEWLEAAEEFEIICRDALKYLAGTDSAKGGGISVIRSLTKGGIDYSKIPALKELDLDQFRKPPSERWTIRTLQV